MVKIVMKNMDINFDDSPWFHVHFTVPNQTTKRRLLVSNCERQQRRITNITQANNKSFLATKNKTASHRKTNLNQRRITKEKQRQDNVCKIVDKTNKLVDNKQNDLFIESSKETIIAKKVTLPPLKASTSVISCQGQHSTVTPSGAPQRDIPEKPMHSSARANNKLSIATCYDLYEWKPMSSVVGSDRSRPLVSILKHNARHRHKGHIVDHSDTSGYDTDHDVPLRTTKKVRFAKGTIFSSSKGRRTRRNYTRHSDSDDNEWESLDDEMSFSEFIQRKRCERTVQCSSNTFCKRSTDNFKFLKNKSLHSKQNHRNHRCHKNDMDIVLPTIIN